MNIFIADRTSCTLENSQSFKIPVYECNSCIDPTLIDECKSVASLESSTSGGGDVEVGYPVGVVYVQFPGTDEPSVLFPDFTWTELNYDGAFFRAAGTCACGFNCGLQSESTSTAGLSASLTSCGNHYHVATCPGACNPYYDGTCLRNISDTCCDECPTVHCYLSTSSTCCTATYCSGCGNHTHTLTLTSTCSETRPRNYTIRIWKRTA